MKLPEPAKQIVIGDQIVDHIEDYYTEAQMRQAIKDAYEEAAKVCDEFECSLKFPTHCAKVVRKLKETI